MIVQNDLDRLHVLVGCNRGRAEERIEDQDDLLRCGEVDRGILTRCSDFALGTRVPDRISAQSIRSKVPLLFSSRN